MNDEPTTRPPPRAVPVWAYGAAAFALFAVGLELLAGSWANSRAPAWAETLAPLSWAPWARGLWWLAVAVAVGLFHLGLARAGQRRHPVVIAATIAPFALFAYGAATGAEWAIFH